MRKVGDHCDAKQILLDKLLRGEIAFATGMGQGESNADTTAQHSSSRRLGLEEESKQDQASIDQAQFHASSSAGSRATGNAHPIRRSLVRRGLNRFLHLLCRFGPGGTSLRPFFHRVRGVQVGKNVWIGDEVYLDNDFPECVEIQDGAMIELRTTIVAHTHGAGRVVIGRNAFIGAGAVIVTAGNRTLVIGEGAVIMASSRVTGNVAPYTLYGSDSYKPLAKITKPFTPDTTYEEFIAALRPLSGLGLRLD